MKFYNDKGEVFEAANVKEFAEKRGVIDADQRSVWAQLCDMQVVVTLFYMRNEKYEPVEISRLFQVLNPNTNSITDKYSQNGYSGRVVAGKSSEVAGIVKAILKRAGRDEDYIKSSSACKAKLWNEHIEEMMNGLRNKFKREQFLIRAKSFRSELNALLDKYGFVFEGEADSDYDSTLASASLYVREKEIVDSKRHKIEIMNFEDDEAIEYPELEIGSVWQESYN